MMRSGRQTDSEPEISPASGQAHRTRTGVLLSLVGLLGSLLLLGCEDTQTCFPIGAGCTQANASSEFFLPNAPCCEGTCTVQPPPPVGSDPGTIAICQ